ncbi:MAG: hypothetical protein WD876_03395 [Candidatus Pacearchaeota archaeon]
MPLKIISEKENSLFSRKEIVAEIIGESTPKKTEVETLLAQKFSSIPDAIKIDRILSKFGSNNFVIHAKIYNSKEEKENIEPKIKVKAKTA